MKTAHSAKKLLKYIVLYLTTWDRRHLNSTYTHRISSYQQLSLWPQVDNNDILPVVGFSHNAMGEIFSK